jgi:hypothetical protein
METERHSSIKGFDLKLYKSFRRQWVAETEIEAETVMKQGKEPRIAPDAARNTQTTFSRAEHDVCG